MPSSKYYDVESGTEREWSHDHTCMCSSCSKKRLRETLTDIITSHKAFAPSSKKRPKAGGFGGVKPDYSSFTPKEPINDEEGKCFGWNPEADSQIYTYNQEEVYMHLEGRPASPDMTKGDMAVMSVDQAKAVLTLKVLYNPFFNQRLKERIEPKYRNWNPANKCWELHPSKMKDVQQICQEFYKGVQIIGQKPVLGTKFEKLLSKLSKDDKLSMYRILAMKYHPDKGGNHEVMSLVNEVFKNG